MAEICESPFDYDNYWDVHVKREIDIQLFIGSLALYPKYADLPDVLNWTKLAIVCLIYNIWITKPLSLYTSQDSFIKLENKQFFSSTSIRWQRVPEMQ